MSEIFNDLDYDRDIAPSKNKFGFSGMEDYKDQAGKQGVCSAFAF